MFASPSMCLISLLSFFFLFGETNPSSVWRLNLWDVSLVLVQQSVASNLPQCCRVATCACCRRCPRSAISCTLPISDGLWGSWATKRLGFLASCAASLSLSLPFLPPPLRSLHSFAQLMKINESKNVAYSLPWSRLLPFFVAFALFSFPFLCPFYSALLWVLHALIYIARRSSSCGNANGAAEVAATAAAAVAFHFKAATKTSTATQSTWAE